MENSKSKLNITITNYLTIKYVSLIALGFAIFILCTDFLFQNVWHQDYLYVYRIFDIVFAIVSALAVLTSWLFRNINSKQQKILSLGFPFLVLIWSAILTGIDFQMFGLMTYVIVLFLCTFFLYLNQVLSIVFIVGSSLSLLTTIYIEGRLIQNYQTLTFLLVPILIISFLMTSRNYKNKLTDMANQEKIIEMNKNLVYAIENLEIEVKNRTSEIQKAKEKAEESDRLKSSFLQNMSHEIRTPLNAIAGFSKLITKPNQNAEKLKFFSNIIWESSHKLIDIITDVIEISQIHANQVKLTTTKFNFLSLINKIATDFKDKAIQKKIDFVLNSKILQNDSEILTDKEKLERTLIHLIDNALKFTIKGKIEIKCEIEHHYLKISISDTGVGISDEMQSLIFEPFRQVESGIIRNFGGNGLGLAIAKSYLQLLNGHISLKSEIHKGTTVSVTLPVNRSESPIKEKQLKKQIDSINTLLIVEDEFANYQYLLELLEETGLKILYADNGLQAIDLCRNNLEIDLILMDIKMPIMDGYTATKLIKEFRPEIIFIAQTAYALEIEKESFLEVFDDYITKPINEIELKQILKKYINK